MSNNKEANAVPTAPDEPPRLIHVDDPDTPVDSLTDTAQAQNTETDGPPAEQSGAVIEYDFSSADLYLNRELTWLSFNARVLHEAQDERNPLLERVKFLAFSDNNLDEFVMKRIGGLKQQLAAGVQQTTVDGRTPAQQMAECNAEIRALRAKQEQVYSGLLTELEKHDIRFLQYEELTAAQRLRIRDSFIKNIFPIVTPLAMDPSHPFPFISNLAVNLLLTMRFPGDNELQMARVKVPSIKGLTSRLLPVAEPDAGHLFVSLDEVMANNLDLLFPGMEIASCELFRVTRNINVVRNEETATDLLEMIETELRERQFAPIVRLEVERGMAACWRPNSVSILIWMYLNPTACWVCVICSRSPLSIFPSCAMRRCNRRIIRFSRRMREISFILSATTGHFSCSTRTSRLVPQWSGFCARPVKTQRSWRSR
jgi:hypothetical protein